MNGGDDHGSLLEGTSTESTHEIATDPSDEATETSPTDGPTRAELYENVPDEIPRFVVRRLDDETLARLADSGHLNWTERR